MMGADEWAAHLSQPELRVSEGGHCASYADTWDRLKELLTVVPVTRVYDVGRMDYLGFCVWSAVTPLAKDLTVHAGKGTCAEAARISAVMEAIERLSAERTNTTINASMCELEATGTLYVDPQRLGIPGQVAKGRRIAWTPGFDLGSRLMVLVPEDTVVSPASGQLLRGPETNGLASGNTILEATLHALLECIERDATATESFYTDNFDRSWSPARPHICIRPRSLPAPLRRYWRALTSKGLRVAVTRIPHPAGVPVVAVWIADEDFAGSEGRWVICGGSSADLNAERACARAFHEAAQSHAVLFLGARDAFEGDDHNEREPSYTRDVERFLLPASHDWNDLFGEPAKDGDLAESLRRVVGQLAGSGVDAPIVVDLTKPQLKIPVVRVVTPGLGFPYGDSVRLPSYGALRSVLGQL